jgi:hypothetical protein
MSKLPGDIDKSPSTKATTPQCSPEPRRPKCDRREPPAPVLYFLLQYAGRRHGFALQ